MRDDATLVGLAVQGDSQAFAELYERYFDRVFDFLARMLRDQAEAADLTQDTFVRAMNSLGSLASGASFKSWLFTIARNTALNRIERSSRLQPLQGRSDDDDEPAFDVVDADRFGNPEQAAEANDLAALVWQAAKGLDPNQYAVLDLTVRQGLDSAEVADVLGVTKNNAYVMVNRMKKALEDAVGALMLFRAGRSACSELDTLLADVQLGDMTPEARRLIDRHASRCDICGEKKRTMASPFAIFGGFAMVMPPAGAKASVLEGLLGSFPYSGVSVAEASFGDASSGAAPGNAGPGAPHPAPAPVADFASPPPPPVSPMQSGSGPDPDDDARKGSPWRWLAGAAAVLLIGLAGLFAVNALSSDAENRPAALVVASSTSTPASTSTVQPTSTATASATPVVTSTPGLIAPSVTATRTPGLAISPTLVPPGTDDPQGEDPDLTDPECTPVLRASTSNLHYTPNTTSLTFLLSGADCSQPVPYTLAADHPWVLPPSGGQIPADTTIAITVRIDRRAIPGGATSNLHITAPTGTLTLPIQADPASTLPPTHTPTPFSLTTQPTSTPTLTCAPNCLITP